MEEATTTASAPAADEKPPEQALQKKKPYSAMTTKERRDSLKDSLERMMPTLSALVPKGWSPRRVAQLAMVAVARTPKLLECTPLSFMRSVCIAAELGLEPSGTTGQAYILPFNNKDVMEAQFIPGYKGLITLARRSGALVSLTAEVVYEKDAFSYTLGTDAAIHHERSEEDKPGELKYVYAVAHLTGGGMQFVVLNRREVMKVRDSSAAVRAGGKGAQFSPWYTWEEEMWKKTAIKRVAKMIPSSAELQVAVAADDRAEEGREALDVLTTASIILPEAEGELDLSGLEEEPPATRTEEIKTKIAGSKGKKE